VKNAMFNYEANTMPPVFTYLLRCVAPLTPKVLPPCLSVPKTGLRSLLQAPGGRTVGEQSLGLTAVGSGLTVCF
jgi:hypothetical protein